MDLDTLSTVIDTEAGPSASGGGQVPIADIPEPENARADLEAVFKADAKKAEPETAKEPVAKPEPKEPKPEEAPEKAPEADKAPAADKEPEGDEKQPEAKPEVERDKGRYPEPPSKFLPDAKEHWRNVPRAVQRDIATLTADHEREIGQYRESHERYESVRQFDEIARGNGRELKDSLARVVEIENALQANPIAGLNRILMEVGPRKADGQPVSLYEVAEHIVRAGPDGYRQMMAQGQPQQQQAPREDPRISQLEQRLAAMQEEQLANQVIQPFMAEHPRYAELEQDIAFFLQSGRIPTSLSAPERLEAAYDMAARINPSSHASAQDQQDRPEPELDRRADPSFSGNKSIKSAPGSVTEEVADEAPGGESIRDTLRKEMRRLNR